MEASSLRLRAKGALHRADSSSNTSGTDAAVVHRQPDGLPRLPSHLNFGEHYAKEHHCPVCSLDEGEQHQPGVPSHAATLMLQPPTLLAPLRSIDEHGLALMQSLSRPKHHPSWWGPRFKKLQARCAELLESSATHYTIIALTLLDLGIVVAELILSSIFPAAEVVPHAVHTTEEVLSWCSIAILCVFTAELVAKLAVFGHRYFTSSWWHMADAVVVITSLTLELTLRGIAQEVASLLIFFRLWRILRVMHGVAEAMELNHEHELEQHHLLVHGLQKDLSEQARRVRQLEREVAALSGAAAGAGVDVPSILRLAAAAASQPDMMMLQAETADAAAAAAAARTAGGGGQARTSNGGSCGGYAEDV